MTALLSFHFGLTSVVYLACLSQQLTQGANSFLVGSAIVFFDLAILGWCWTQILQKKLIALVLVVIVLKYAFLIAVIDWALSDSRLSSAWICGGLASIVPTVLLFAWWQNRRQSPDQIQNGSESE